MTKFNHFDARKVMQQIGQYDDVMTATCMCGATVREDDDACYRCNLPVVWSNSHIWQKIYGPANVALRELNLVKPYNELSQKVIAACGLAGFCNAAEAKRWESYALQLGSAYVNEIVEYVVERKREKGVGALNHILNLAAKYIREGKVASAEATTAVEFAEWKE